MIQNPGAVLLPVKQQVILKPPDVIQNGVATMFKLSPPAVPLASQQSATQSVSRGVHSPSATHLASQQNSSPHADPLTSLQTAFKLSPLAVPLASSQSGSPSASGSVLSTAALPLVSQQKSSPTATPLAKLQTLQSPLAVPPATSGTLLPIIDNKTGFPLPVGSHIVQRDSGDSFLMVPVAIPTQQVTQVRSNTIKSPIEPPLAMFLSDRGHSKMYY